MIHLHPIPDVKHICPYCNVPLKLRDWLIPGMRNLGHLICPQCQIEFYGDLPSGHGLYYPMLLESDTGIVHDNYSITWFADWLPSMACRSLMRTTVPRKSGRRSSPVLPGVALIRTRGCFAAGSLA